MNAAEKLAEQAFVRAGRTNNQPVGLETIRASEIEVKAIDWLWPNRFALGKLGLLAGLPDRGKGLITADMIARITNEQINDWPCGEGKAINGSVILLSGEDDAADTIVPRLMATDADLTKVHLVQMTKNTDGSKRTFSLVTDLELLQKKIEEIGDVVMVVIDPLTAYLGVGKVNTFQGGDVRGVLMPLVELAAKHQFFALGIMHFNKKADVSNALLRISDSLAFGAVARHCFAVTDDLANDRKLFVKAKNNLAPDVRALSYGVTAVVVANDHKSGKEIWAPRLVWGLEHVEISAVQAMEAESNGNAATNPREEAKELLQRLLANGPVSQKVIEDEAEGALISWATMRRAKKDLKVESKKDSMNGGWVWSLPAQTTRNYSNYN